MHYPDAPSCLESTHTPTPATPRLRVRELLPSDIESSRSLAEVGDKRNGKTILVKDLFIDQRFLSAPRISASSASVAFSPAASSHRTPSSPLYFRIINSRFESKEKYQCFDNSPGMERARAKSGRSGFYPAAEMRPPAVRRSHPALGWTPELRPEKLFLAVVLCFLFLYLYPFLRPEFWSLGGDRPFGFCSDVETREPGGMHRQRRRCFLTRRG